MTYDTPITMVIDSPTRRTKFPYGMGRTAADVYAYQVLNPVRNYDKSTSFSYTYGGRHGTFRRGRSKAEECLVDSGQPPQNQAGGLVTSPSKGWRPQGDAIIRTIYR